MTKRTRHDPHHPTPHVALEDQREAIELSPTENADLCSGCVKCCTYITVEVDAPRQAWEYDQWIWTIDHHGIEMYLEKPEKWFVHVDTPCRHLQDNGRCAIYGSHPVLCREYDPRECERRLPLTDIVAKFRNGDELAAWIAQRRPVHYQRLLAYRGSAAPGWPGGDAPAMHTSSAAAHSAPRGGVVIRSRKSSASASQLIPLAMLAGSITRVATNGGHSKAKTPARRPSNDGPAKGTRSRNGGNRSGARSAKRVPAKPRAR